MNRKQQIEELEAELKRTIPANRRRDVKGMLEHARALEVQK